MINEELEHTNNCLRQELRVAHKFADQLRGEIVGLGIALDKRKAELTTCQQQRDELVMALKLMLNPVRLERDREAIARRTLAKLSKGAK